MPFDLVPIPPFDIFVHASRPRRMAGELSRDAEARGGVAPIGHPAPLRTIVDIDLANFDEVWAAGGHPHYVFPTSFDELVRITGGTPAGVGA